MIFRAVAACSSRILSQHHAPSTAGPPALFLAAFSRTRRRPVVHAREEHALHAARQHAHAPPLRRGSRGHCNRIPLQEPPAASPSRAWQQLQQSAARATLSADKGRPDASAPIQADVGTCKSILRKASRPRRPQIALDLRASPRLVWRSRLPMGRPSCTTCSPDTYRCAGPICRSWAWRHRSLFSSGRCGRAANPSRCPTARKSDTPVSKIRSARSPLSARVRGDGAHRKSNGLFSSTGVRVPPSTSRPGFSMPFGSSCSFTARISCRALSLSVPRRKRP